MKKVFLTVLLFLGFALNSTAQDVNFGVTGGFLNAGARVKVDGITISDTQAGFYVGILAEFEVTEKFKVQPELLFATVDGSNALFLPVLGKIYLSNGFNLQVGPQFGISLEESVDDFSSFSIEVAGGLGYDITDAFFIEARYSQQLNNSFTGDLDITARGNGLYVGVGYKFN